MTAVTGATYELATGRILMIAIGPDEDFLHLQILGKEDTQGVFVGAANMKTQYVVEGALADRPVMPLVLSKTGDPIELALHEELSVTDVPPGTRLYHPAGVEDDIQDGFIEWASESAGDFTLSFMCFPYQEVVLHAKVG